MTGLPELLAPAGSKEALWAAVANGANAVYLGGKRFSARQSAANFTMAELEEALEFTHLRGVKLYVTVNTLIAPGEFGPVLEYLFELSELGVDGVLVQDLGLAAVARRVLPDLPLHASTQMTIHNVEGVRFLAEAGLSRVVLARELSLEDMKLIKTACPEMELEVFVHGALCFCYSGQCLLSSFVGGRSGNRGSCAQPCRLSYRLLGGELDPQLRGLKGHLLSTKDLNLLQALPELARVGVAALKIEGRMKRPEYVATVTRVYRGALDRYAASPGTYKVSSEEQRQLAQIFNREFTQGYLSGNPGCELTSHLRPNNRGLYLGRVAARSAEGVAVRLEGDLNLGDGLEFWVSHGGHKGLVVRNIWRDGVQVPYAAEGETVMLETVPGVMAGDRVFKTNDSLLIEKVRQTFSNPGCIQKVPLRLTVSGRAGDPLLIVAQDPDGHRVEVRTLVPCQQARTHALDERDLMAQLGRLGGTPFYLDHLQVELDGEIMVPFSSLNEARRRMVTVLSGLRLRAGRPYPRMGRTLFQNRVSSRQEVELPGFMPEKSPYLSVAVSDPASARAALAAGADRVYLTAEQWTDRPRPSAGELKQLKQLAGAGRDLWLALPYIWHPVEAPLVNRWVDLIEEVAPPGVLVRGAGGLELSRRRLNQFMRIADYTFNVYNGFTASYLVGSGFSGLTLSPELNLHQLGLLTPLSAFGGELIVHGNFPLMVSAHCVIGAGRKEKGTGRQCKSRACRPGGFALEDRLGYSFPVACDRQCRFYLFNSRELCLLSRLPELLRLDPAGMRLELGRSGPAEIQVVVRAYREWMDRCRQSKPVSSELIEAEESLMQFTGRCYTRGHYFRGLQA